MKTKFNVGDRIVVYSGVERIKTTVSAFSHGFIRAENCSVYHPKQCRKLVKKKRREFLVRTCVNGEHALVWNGELESSILCDFCEIIRVREVKK